MPPEGKSSDAGREQFPSWEGSGVGQFMGRLRAPDPPEAKSACVEPASAESLRH